jgi:hypothetical protein
MDAQQELFTTLKLNIERQGYAVYDGALPPADTPYPFVYLGDFAQNDRDTKSHPYGNVFPTIHVWHNNPNERGTVSEMLRQVKLICRRISHTQTYAWSVRNVNSRIITDTTTRQPLLHGIVEGEWFFF